MGLCLRLQQFSLLHKFGQRRKAYKREALKAFKKVRVDGKDCFTCNVRRLRECDRIGDEKEIPLFRTHFFLQSRAFRDVEAVIFNIPPGKELSGFVRLAQIDSIFVVLSEHAIVNALNGRQIILEKPLLFASDSVDDPLSSRGAQ